MNGPELVVLAPDHPGFRDLVYRTRRDEIASRAIAWRGGPAPRVAYTADEHALWRRVRARLDPLHAERVASPLLAAAARLGLSRERIPQLAEVSVALEGATGFRLAPVAGLIAPRAFLSALGAGLFFATQYVRHPSAPFYTPEPDVIHELVGHAASLACPAVAAASLGLGEAARLARDAELLAIERVYWHALEFGAVLEAGRIRAFGAGLLSSAAELERLDASRLVPWSVEAAAATPYDPTALQPRYFVAPSVERLLDDVLRWATTRTGATRGVDA